MPLITVCCFVCLLDVVSNIGYRDRSDRVVNHSALFQFAVQILVQRRADHLCHRVEHQGAAHHVVVGNVLDGTLGAVAGKDAEIIAVHTGSLDGFHSFGGSSIAVGEDAVQFRVFLDHRFGVGGTGAHNVLADIHDLKNVGIGAKLLDAVLNALTTVLHILVLVGGVNHDVCVCFCQRRGHKCPA